MITTHYYLALRSLPQFCNHSQLASISFVALIDGQPRSATAVAAADCSVAAINEKRFLRLVEVTPRFALQVMQVITERLRRKTRTSAG
jgi:CRP-like cAMP-binding protein